jgi:hypothetical protein
MGVAPEAIVELFFGYRLKEFAPCLVFRLHDLYKQKFLPFLLSFSSGARPALPMGVAPEAMVEFLGGDHRLKISFDLYSFDLASMRDIIDMITFCNDLTGR